MARISSGGLSTHIDIFNTKDKKTMQKYICEPCGYIYDPELGDEDGGIAPGTPFEDIPEDWVCPVCGAEKSDFAPYNE